MLHLHDDHDFDMNPPDDEQAGTPAHYSRSSLGLEVKIEQIRACTGVKDVMRLAIAASGLDDAEIYQAIGINQGYFSKIRTGEATLKAEKEVAFCERVGNRVYPEWRAYLHGCTMVDIKRYEELLQKERQAEELQHELNSLRTLIRNKVAE